MKVIYYTLVIVSLLLVIFAIVTEKWSIINLQQIVMSQPGLSSNNLQLKNNISYNIENNIPSNIQIQKIEGSVSLWNVCGQINGSITDDGEEIKGGGIGCLNIPIKKWKNLPVNSLTACRVLAITSAFFLFIALIFMNLDLRIISTICLVLGSLTCFVVCIIWYKNFTKLTFDERQREAINLKIGYSFICNLVCGILTLISAVGFFLLTK
jgi:hypothetical protein